MMIVIEHARRASILPRNEIRWPANVAAKKITNASVKDAKAFVFRKLVCNRENRKLMKQKGDLDARLENWAKAQRYGPAAGSVIGSAEGRYRGDNPEPRSIDAMLLDLPDADVVERAWGRLMPFDKDVLRMHYILRMSPPLICRKLKLPRNTNGTFMMALAHAKSEIGKALAKIEETARVHREHQRSYHLARDQFRK